ncbi:MAG: hypothetical protein CL828_07185, partial [Crocinitomicaceae bacterium]|nr:hypothetical protein [Crocinitomicaceae bacterium]
MANVVLQLTFNFLLYSIIAPFMKPTALIRLAFFAFGVSLIFGPSMATGQIGLPPAGEPPKGGKVDEQTQMQNRIREKDEMKR